jgi:hypothetical protein
MNPDTIAPITLPPATNAEQERQWLEQNLLTWLNDQFIPEPVNQDIAHRAGMIYMRQRMEGENDLISLVMAILTEFQAYDFSQSFFGEFAVANAVGELILDSLGYDRCCGQ